MNSADFLVFLFVFGCVVGLGGALIEASFILAAERREQEACRRLSRQPRIGLRERLGGEEISQRRAERAR